MFEFSDTPPASTCIVALMVVLLCLPWVQTRAQENAVRTPLEFGILWRQEAHQMKSNPYLQHTAVKPALNFQPYVDSIQNYKSWLSRKLFSEDFFFKEEAQWKVRLNPIFDIRPGREFGASENILYHNYGGAISVQINDKWALYTEANTGWANFPAYLDSFIETSKVVPGRGFARFGSQSLSYQMATTHISYRPSKLFNFQLGQDRHFIGDGYRSLLLSDVSFPMPYIRSQLNLGPFQYTNWVMQLMDVRSNPLSWNLGYRKKYSAMSYLSLQLNKRINFGVFQAVVWQADDSIAGKRVFPWQYLNPLIFYWPIQFSSGSEGNLLLAVTSRINLDRLGILYGQFLLDEVVNAALFANEGSLANKFGGQIGWKHYKMFGRQNWFLQAEVNMVRPHTYSHWSPLTNYSHFSQPLAHPAGANFREFLLATSLPISENLFWEGKYIYTQLGRDTAGLALGQDIFKNFQNAPGGLTAKGIFIGNGLPANSLHLENVLSYVVNPRTNLRFEIRWIYRKEDMTISQRNTNWIMLGIRSQIANLYHDF